LRKVIAILLIFILLFNIGGYRIVIALMQDRADQQLETLLDKSEYDESQLVEIKVAMNMPYQQRFTEYERHYGEIEIDGVAYTYVKKKIEGDVVIFKCIANQSKQELKDINHSITKGNSAADVNQPGPGKKQPVSFAKKLLSEYDDQFMFALLKNQTDQSLSHIAGYQFSLSSLPGRVPHQPPKC
jgi:aspartate 1-decarboxylase